MDALFAAELDGVVVAAATAAHPELIIRCVNAGLPVLCEKPLAGTIAEAEDVVRRTAGSDAPVLVGYQRRFDPGYAAVRAAVRSGELGWVHTARALTLDPSPPPAAYIRGSGGIFRDCSVHDFDALRWVLGREVVSVFATGANHGDPIFAEVGDVDSAAAVLNFDGGVTALVSNSRYNARGHDCRLEVHGSRDTVAAGWDDGVPVRSVEPGTAWPAGPPWTFFIDRFAGAYAAELSAFADLVAGRGEPMCTAADALETAYVAEACTFSLRERRLVEVDEVRAGRS